MSELRMTNLRLRFLLSPPRRVLSLAGLRLCPRLLCERLLVLDQILFDLTQHRSVAAALLPKVRRLSARYSY